MQAPPFWLRKLGLAAEACAELPERSPAERLRLATDLMAFALACLERQARERGCTSSEVLLRYEQAERRFRSRAS